MILKQNLKHISTKYCCGNIDGIRSDASPVSFASFAAGWLLIAFVLSQNTVGAIDFPHSLKDSARMNGDRTALGFSVGEVGHQARRVAVENQPYQLTPSIGDRTSGVANRNVVGADEI